MAVTAVEFIKSRGWNIDIIVPVPATTARKEQPVLLAEAIGGIIAVPVSLSTIVKVKDLPPLKNVTDYKQRIELLTGAYKVFVQEVIEQRSCYWMIYIGLEPRYRKFVVVLLRKGSQKPFMPLL